MARSRAASASSWTGFGRSPVASATWCGEAFDGGERLAEIAAELERSKEWSGVNVVDAYVFGELLGSADDVELIKIAVAVDEPSEKVPWMSHPARLEALAATLRFNKLPMSWWWRPKGMADLGPRDHTRRPFLVGDGRIGPRRVRRPRSGSRRPSCVRETCRSGGTHRPAMGRA
jgi:hypothetical protein